MLLENKTAIVTGASSGIGKAITLAFLREGASVIGIGTNPEKGKKLIEEAASLSPLGSLTFECCDLSEKGQIDALFAKIDASPIDILVNNAGITRDGLIVRMPIENWDSVLDTNLRSCFLTCQHACKKMIKAKQGCIINISSIVGLMGNAGQTNYAASKAGIIGFSNSLAREMASRKIRVNCIAPGFITTDMTGALTEQQIEAATKTIPLRRMGTTEEIAQAALFLASNMSSYITGQTLVVDGGLYIS